MLKAIGSPLTDMGIEDEKGLSYFDENGRHTHQCSIPHRMRENRSEFAAALRYLMAYSYRTQDDEELRDFADTVIDEFAKMVHYGRANNKIVREMEIIDRLNEINRRSSLADWMIAFLDFWKEYIADHEVRNKTAYLRECCQTYLFEYKIHNITPAIR